MNYLGSSPRCGCGRHYLSTMPTDHFCTYTYGTASTATIAVNRVVYVGPPDDVLDVTSSNEFEQACRRAKKRMEGKHCESWRDRRRRWREEAAQGFARRR